MFFLFTGKERRGEEKSRLSECGMLELFYGFKAEVKQFLIENFKIKSYCISSGKFCKIHFQKLFSFEFVIGTLLYRAGGCLFYINSHGSYHPA